MRPCHHLSGHRLLGYFNPRTREGCDFEGGLPYQVLTLNFNPRTREGCDDYSDENMKSLVDISIHAPARGATGVIKAPYSSLNKFQSTHPRGVRHGVYFNNDDYIEFQSTHPRGVRRSASKNCVNCILFQSTHPRGVRRKISAE